MAHISVNPPLVSQVPFFGKSVRKSPARKAVRSSHSINRSGRSLAGKSVLIASQKRNVVLEANLRALGLVIRKDANFDVLAMNSDLAREVDFVVFLSDAQVWVNSDNIAHLRKENPRLGILGVGGYADWYVEAGYADEGLSGVSFEGSLYDALVSSAAKARIADVEEPAGPARVSVFRRPVQKRASLFGAAERIEGALAA